MKIKLFIFFMLLSFLGAHAQEVPAMADSMREDGKIWVVIGVITLIFAAIVGMLIILERKIKRLEDHFKNKQ